MLIRQNPPTVRVTTPVPTDYEMVLWKMLTEHVPRVDRVAEGMRRYVELDRAGVTD